MAAARQPWKKIEERTQTPTGFRRWDRGKPVEEDGDDFGDNVIIIETHPQTGGRNHR